MRSSWKHPAEGGQSQRERTRQPGPCQVTSAKPCPPAPPPHLQPASLCHQSPLHLPTPPQGSRRGSGRSPAPETRLSNSPPSDSPPSGSPAPQLPAPQLGRLPPEDESAALVGRKDLRRGTVTGLSGLQQEGLWRGIRQTGTTLSPHPHPHPRLRQSPRRTRLKGTAAPLPASFSCRQKAERLRTAPPQPCAEHTRFSLDLCGDSAFYDKHYS